MFKIEITGTTIEELKANIEALAASYAQATATTTKTPAAKVETKAPEQEDKETEGTSQEFDGVSYGLASASRTTWLLLKDGRGLEIKAGSRLPLEKEIEKRIKKAEYKELDAFAKNIGDVNKDTKPATIEEPEEVEEVEEVEETPAQEDKKLKRLVKKVKKLDGGAEFLAELLDEYDVQKVTDLVDEDDVADFIDDLTEFIEDAE